MVDIYIHKEVLGFKQHLLCLPSGELRRVGEELPDEAILIYGDPSFLEVSKLYSLPFPSSFPPPSHVKALRTALGSQDVSKVPWSLAMPPRAFTESVKALGKDLVERFGNLDLNYYQTHYKRGNMAFSRLHPAKIDRRAWMVHSSNRDLVTPHVFATFEPDPDGYAEEVIYSRCDTRTGRLKVLEGPNILLLPKEQRNILASRFGFEGQVMHLDYSSLEPRLALLLSNLSSPLPPPLGYPPRFCANAQERDLYFMVMRELGITDIPRELVKEVVLSQLYGASYETIMGKLEGVPNPLSLIEALGEFFSLPALRARILKEYEANNRQFIHSYYGRRVDTQGINTYMLLNYYIQSTAVDVAMYGFRNILRHIQGNSGIAPLFILHDALVLDVHKDMLPFLSTLCDIGSKNIPLFPSEISFPLKSSHF
jgi:hypothetical protein